MTKPRTSRFILALFSCLLCVPVVRAQVNTPPSQQPAEQRQRGIQYVPETKEKETPIKLFQGFSVGFDLAGLVMYAAANYGQIEGQLHLNLKERIFPVFEVGMGHCDHEETSTNLKFKTNAPYFRIGCDYNFNKDLSSKNRVFGGVRYGYSNFNFDLSGPTLVDPVWGASVPYNFKSQNSAVHWWELVFGLEAKIWKDLHIGWTARYRRRLKQEIPEVGQAWYVPGFGKNDGHTFGGTFQIIFDI